MYHQFEEDRDKGDFSKLPELHAVLSGMKARALFWSRVWGLGSLFCRRHSPSFCGIHSSPSVFSSIQVHYPMHLICHLASAWPCVVPCLEFWAVKWEIVSPSIKF